MKVHVGDIQFNVFLYYAQTVKFDLGPLIVGKPKFFFHFWKVAHWPFTKCTWC